MEQHPHFLSPESTLVIRGMAALTIMVLHFAMQIDGYPSILNVPAGPCVAAFLFISGFGLHESWKRNQGKAYWRKRIVGVLLPYWLVILFQIPFYEEFSITRLLNNLLVTNGDLWFIDYIVRWYLLYWLGQRFLPRYTPILLLGASIYSLTLNGLMAGQSFSFLAGYLASCKIEQIRNWSRRKNLIILSLAILYGILFLALKEIPWVAAQKGSLTFNLFLVNIMLPLSAILFGLVYLLPALTRSKALHWLGKISYEIYIVHYNFMPFVAGRIAYIAIYTVASIFLSHVFHLFNTLLSQRELWSTLFAVTAFTGINYMLLCKYAMRATTYFGPIILAYLVFFILCFYLLLKTEEGRGVGIKKIRQHINGKTLTIGLCLILVLTATIQYHFDPLQNNVDRWSAIAYPLRNLLHGEFPYLAETHLGGKASPFPAWQVFHLPFYLLGNVGLSGLFAIACFVYSIYKLLGSKTAHLALLCCTISICLWYEISVRSDLVTLFLLLSAFANLMQSKNLTFREHPFALSIVAGLWLSTRLNVVFPLFFLFFPDWMKCKFQTKLATPFLCVFTFLLTFLPFYIWNAEALIYSDVSPVTLQTRQGYTSVAIALLAISFLLLFFYMKNTKPLSGYNIVTACTMMLAPTLAFSRKMWEEDSWNRLFESDYDITYFNAALPFLITAICIGVQERQRSSINLSH